MRDQFIAVLQEALSAAREPRFFKTERGYQGELLAELKARVKEAEFPGDAIIEQEYQKTIPAHKLKIRPDLIIHIPFERGVVARRVEGNFVAIETKRNSTQVPGAFENLRLMKEVLRYPLTVLIMVDTELTYAELCPASIAAQTVCFAVALRNGNPVVRREACVGVRRRRIRSPRRERPG